ncbi:hypothetical protein EV421DRAFT_1861241 [Armillaria borealis]|uniref:Uncharacterized protein n=1 Tax=Armillaria borealis TaxID=47425 RepID=A0AA39IUK9_9AGAR|nr:hypothetical protein EV421DRAFT_1861241 [Armillaria borealis]
MSHQSIAIKIPSDLAPIPLQCLAVASCELRFLPEYFLGILRLYFPLPSTPCTSQGMEPGGQRSDMGLPSMPSSSLCSHCFIHRSRLPDRATLFPVDFLNRKSHTDLDLLDQFSVRFIQYIVSRARLVYGLRRNERIIIYDVDYAFCTILFNCISLYGNSQIYQVFCVRLRCTMPKDL